MRLRYVAQNNFISDEIGCEATKVRADTQLQKSLPGKGIPLKTTQAFLKIFRELYSAYFKTYVREFIFPVYKIFQVLCPLRYASYSARPI